MSFSITLRRFHLRVLSSLLIDLTAGLLLMLFTIRDLKVLTVDFVFAIVFLALAIKIEEFLGKTHD